MNTPSDHPTLSSTPIVTPALIIGAGPAGLFTAFQLGLLEVSCHIVDALPYAGGQCAVLYGDKPIYDVPGMPVCTGAQLTEYLLQQIRPFSPPLHVGQTVVQLHQQLDGQWLAQSSQGQQWLAQTVFIAAGVGAFQPRSLGLAQLEQALPNWIHYHPNGPHDAGVDADAFTDLDIVVLGDSHDALQSVLDLCADTAHRARSVTLLHRRDAFKTEAHQVAQMRSLVQQGAMRLAIGQIDETATLQALGQAKADTTSTHTPQAPSLVIRDVQGQVQSISCHALWVQLGLVPSLKPLAQWPLHWQDKLIAVNPHSFGITSEGSPVNFPALPSTSLMAGHGASQGLYAIGDIAYYAGKRKLIVSAFHEATLAAYAAVEQVIRREKVRLEYTTSSKRIHGLLGVAPSETKVAPHQF